MQKNFYFFRHGQTKANINKEQRKRKEAAFLTQLGKQQSEELAKYLSNKNINIFYSSPLKRALSTAEIVSKYTTNAKIIKNRNLNESVFGFWSDNDQQTQEKINETLKKVKNFIYNTALKSDFENIAISSHGSITRALCWVAGQKVDTISNCQCFHFSYKNGEWLFIDSFKPTMN